jgi:glyoxylase-like metal-dependent hydrolase (beta-lactamase superfamily II)
MVEQAADGVYRIEIPIPLPLRTVNCYLLKGRRRSVLVDCPLDTPGALDALIAALAQAGAGPDSIGALLVTHGHPDHIGLAGVLHERWRIPVLLSCAERTITRQTWWTPDTPILGLIARDFIRHGMPRRRARAALQEMTGLAAAMSPVERPRTLAPGTTFRAGGGRWRAQWTPGHADGHLCLFRASDRVLIAGDHLLPVITPNIGLYPGGRVDPLADFLGSLISTERQDAALVLPGHGRGFAGGGRRARELREHHHHRLRVVCAAASGGWVPAYEISRAVFGADLPPDQDRFALAETLSHLEWLRRRRMVTRVARARGWLFRAGGTR